MKRSSVKKLQAAVLILQTIALVLVMLVTVFQEPLKTVLSPDLVGLFSVPMGRLLLMISQLMLYTAAYFVFAKTKLKGTRMKAGILIGILYIGQLILSGCDNIIMRIIAYQGAEALANYSTVNSLVAMAATPIAGIASILFCFTCGGYVGCTDDTVKEAEAGMANTYM